MPRIVMIGAGSVVFAKRLLTDLLSWPALQASEIVLMDIDAGRLELIGALAERLVVQEHLPARIITTTDRRAALDGADYVICSIQVGGLDMYAHDVEIPRRYGIDQTVGDTLDREVSSGACARSRSSRASRATWRSSAHTLCSSITPTP